MTPLDSRSNRTANLAIAAAVSGAGAIVLTALGPETPAQFAMVATVVLAIAAALAARPPQSENAPVVAAPQDVGPDFRAALEGLPDAVLIVEGGDLDDFAARRIRFANAEARQLLKTHEAGAVLVSVMRDPEALEAIDEALFGEMSRTVSFEPGGAQDRIWRLSAAPLKTDRIGAGGPMAVVRFRDETDSRQMERMRADFLANASHELKTPLASLQGFIETLKGHARDDDRARDKFLDIMAAQTARMSRMIADLLSLSRIEMREHIPPSDKADVALATSDVVDALAPLLEDHEARIEVVRGEGSTFVVGDRDQLIQVVQNLTENAIRYAPKGATTTITLRGGLSQAEASAPSRPGAARLSLLTPDRAAETRYVRIDIADQGRGLARAVLPRLTERFYRVEGQKSGATPGTGLGLSIVKHIVNRHRGGMVVESIEGEGATFTIYMPEPAAVPGSHKPVTEPS